MKTEQEIKRYEWLIKEGFEIKNELYVVFECPIHKWLISLHALENYSDDEWSNFTEQYENHKYDTQWSDYMGNYPRL